MAFADEVRQAPAGFEASGNRLSGYAALFGVEAVIAGEFREVIAPGAFANALRKRDVLAILHHLPNRLLGRTSSGTLRLHEDGRGLRFELDVDPSTPDGATALGLVRRRDLKAMSFGFRVLDEDWTPADDLPLRTLREIDIDEISIVAHPAYGGTSVALSEAADTSSAPAWQAAAISSAEAKMRARGLA